MSGLAFQAKRAELVARKEELEGIIKASQKDLANVVRDQALLEEKTNEMIEKLAQATMALANANRARAPRAHPVRSCHHCCYAMHGKRVGHAT